MLVKLDIELALTVFKNGMYHQMHSQNNLDMQVKILE